MIKKIELKRFKKFESTEIVLREFSVLVGENSSGKTSVLQAINLALNAFSREKLYTTENGKIKRRPKGTGASMLAGIQNADFREIYYGKKSRIGTGSNQTVGAELFLTDNEDKN